MRSQASKREFGLYRRSCSNLHQIIPATNIVRLQHGIIKKGNPGHAITEEFIGLCYGDTSGSPGGSYAVGVNKRLTKIKL